MAYFLFLRAKRTFARLQISTAVSLALCLILLGSFCLVSSSAYAGPDDDKLKSAVKQIKTMVEPDSAPLYDFNAFFQTYLTTDVQVLKDAFYLFVYNSPQSKQLQEKGRHFRYKTLGKTQKGLTDFYKKHPLPNLEKDFNDFVLAQNKATEVPISDLEADNLARSSLEKTYGRTLDLNDPQVRLEFQKLKQKFLLTQTKTQKSKTSKINDESFKKFLTSYKTKLRKAISDQVFDILPELEKSGQIEFFQYNSDKKLVRSSAKEFTELIHSQELDLSLHYTKGKTRIAFTIDLDRIPTTQVTAFIGANKKNNGFYAYDVKAERFPSVLAPSSDFIVNDFENAKELETMIEFKNIEVQRMMLSEVNQFELANEHTRMSQSEIQKSVKSLSKTIRSQKELGFYYHPDDGFIYYAKQMGLSAEEDDLIGLKFSTYHGNMKLSEYSPEYDDLAWGLIADNPHSWNRPAGSPEKINPADIILENTFGIPTGIDPSQSLMANSINSLYKHQRPRTGRPLTSHRDVEKEPTNTPKKENAEKERIFKIEDLNSNDTLFFAYSEEWDSPKVLSTLKDPKKTTVVLHTLDATSSNNRIFEIPTPDDYALSALHLTDPQGKTLIQDKDYVIEISGDGLGYRVRFLGSKNVNFKFSAGFAPHPVKTTDLIPMSEKRLSPLIDELDQAGFKAIAKELRSRIAYAMKHKLPITTDMVGEVFDSESLYSYVKEKNIPIDSELVKTNRFAKFMKFINTFGQLCAQCDGSNALFQEFMAGYYAYDTNIKIRPQSGYLYFSSDGGYITSDMLHARSEARYGSKRAKVWDVTPKKHDPNNPVSAKDNIVVNAEPSGPPKTPEDTVVSQRRTRMQEARKQTLKIFEAYNKEHKPGILRDDDPFSRALKVNSLVEDWMNGRVSLEEFTNGLHKFVPNEPKPTTLDETLSLLSKFVKNDKTVLEKFLDKERLYFKARPQSTKKPSRYLDPDSKAALDKFYSTLDSMGQLKSGDFFQYWDFTHVAPEEQGCGSVLEGIIRKAASRRAGH